MYSRWTYLITCWGECWCCCRAPFCGVWRDFFVRAFRQDVIEEEEEEEGGSRTVKFIGEVAR